jgi:hypothetical protein
VEFEEAWEKRDNVLELSKKKRHLICTQNLKSYHQVYISHTHTSYIFNIFFIDSVDVIFNHSHLKSNHCQKSPIRMYVVTIHNFKFNHGPCVGIKIK